MYKKNGGGTWDPVSGTASGGSAGTEGTRTGITSGSKSVTYTGLEVEREYKFTVQAIAGSAAYCDGEETDVTNINSTDVSSTPFKFRYSICIDDGTGNNWTHHYITPTGNTDEGSVTLTSMPAHVDCYQFKIYGGFSGNWGQTGTGKIEGTTATAWTLNGGNQVYLKTGAAGDYIFTVDYSGTTNPKVSVTYPSADQDEGYVIYYDNSVLNWSSLYYRIGNNSNCSKVDAVLVTGTDKFYKITTPDYDNMDAWHIANNYGWTGSNSVYRTKTNSTPAEAAKAITNSISFQQYVVTGDITVIPTTTHSTGEDTGDAGNNNCEFYTINTPTSGMLTHNVSVGTAAHGTLVATYTNTSGATGQTVAEGANADLAHRCIVTITATPDDGYSCTSLTVNGAAFTSGNEHILTADATIAATFTAQTSTVTLDNNDATSGSQQTVSATYDATMPLTTTSSTPVAALSRTGYTFTGWWDATSGGTQYYSYNAGTSTLSSARTWDKTGAQTLKAQWSINSYTLTWAWGGGSTSAASGEDYTAAGSVAYNTALVYPANNTMSRNGYTFTGWSSSATNMPAEALTITAQWEAKQYTVTLDNKSATTSGSTSVTATFDAILPTIIPPTKDGYRFDGYWTEASGGTKYINADGTGATAYKKYSAGEHKLHAHWVAQLTFSVNGAIDDELTRDDNTAMPSTAAVPTACGDCWAFMGWSTNPSESGAPAYAGGATHEFGEPTTLYAVFGKAVYQLIEGTSDLEANAYYALTTLDIDGYEYALNSTLSGNYGTSTDVYDDVVERGGGYYLYNIPANLIWKFTGTAASGRLYNEFTAKYVDLTGGALFKASTSDNLSFTIPDATYSEFNIASVTTSTNKLHIYNDTEWGPTSSATGVYMYKRTSAEYATEPSCETYDIVWKVNGTPLASGSQTEETNACAGIEELPTDPEDDALDCATKFMGWSEYTLTGTGKSAPADLFTDAADAPAIDADKTFHAVFASVDAENTTTVTDNLTCSLTGITGTSYTEWSDKSDNSPAVYAGKSCESTTNKVIQIKSKDSNTGIVTTISGGKAKKITITWSNENTSNRTIDIYGKNSAFSDATDLYNASTQGTKLGSIVYGTSTELTITGDYSYIGIRSNDGAAYLSNVAIKWESAAYKDYMTSCCEKPTFTISGLGKTVTDGKISFPVLREDLGGASSSTWAELPITISSNSSGEITIINGSMPEGGGNIDNAAKTAWKLSAWESRAESGGTITGTDHATFTNPSSGNYLFKVKTTTGYTGQGTYRIGIHQAADATYCEAVVWMWVDVTLRDKFVDAVNGNAEINKDGHGAQLKTPAESDMDADLNDDCNSTTRRLIGWIKETDLQTMYGTPGETGYLEDAASYDASKVVTPYADFTTSGCTWYAVWGEDNTEP